MSAQVEAFPIPVASPLSVVPPLPVPTFKVALYVDKFSTEPVQINTTWEDFAEFLTFVEESPCELDGVKKCVGKECPHKAFSSIPNNYMAWSPVEIDGRRLDPNVRALTILTLDFDHVALDQARRVVEGLAAYEHVRHTTHSHRADDICFRAVLALSRPVHANQWHRFLAAAIEFLKVTVTAVDARGKAHRQPDPTCKNRSRYYYRPSHPRGAPHDVERVRGRVLDVDEVLAWSAEHLPVAIASPYEERGPLPDGSDWDLEGESVLEAIDAIARYFPDRRRHELALALGGMLRRAGATKEDARHILFEAFRDGGSDNPRARADTVDHTWSISDDGAMTGFTRACEILDEDAVEEIGDYFVRAANEAAFKNLTSLSRLGGSNGAAAAIAAPIATPVSLGELRSAVVDLAQRRARSLDRDAQVAGVLLRRVLDGDPLAYPGGHGDVETVFEGATRGIARKEAVRKVASTLAFALPAGTAWDGAREILRLSLAQMAPEEGSDWSLLAERAYKNAQAERAKRWAESELEAQTYRRRVTEAANAAGGGGGAPPLPPSPPAPPDGPDWRDLLTKSASGAIAQIPHNARVLLKNHEDFLGYIRWNEVRKRVEIHGGPMRQYDGLRFEDIVTGIEDHLASAHGLNITYGALANRIISIALANRYDPLRDYLNSLAWDGRERITTWLSTYCGAEETDENRRFLRMVGRRWLIALVARGLQPGCKVDNVLVLEAEGGIGKSAAFSVLGGEWFCDTAITLGDKDSRMMAGQYWICELAELVVFKRTGHDVLKNFFSSAVDKFRLPYGHGIEEFKRRCVFVGTTNDDNYLGDETGNRKYWTVACSYTAEATEALQRDRDQLFAEAVAAFRAGEKWWVGYEEIVVTEAEADKRLIETPAKLKVSAWWYGLQKKSRPNAVTTLEVFESAFNAEAVQAKDGDLMKIGHALKKLGFKRRRDTSGLREWRYYATEELMSADVRVRRTLFPVPEEKMAEGKK